MTDRVAIVGSRAHPNLDLVREYVRSLPPGTVVISGGAAGVDSVAVMTALASELDTVEFYPEEDHQRRFRGGSVFFVHTRCRGPDYDCPRDVEDVIDHAVYSRRDALLLRNTLIVVECSRLVAFPDGSKGGTWDAVAQAKRFRRPVELRYVDGRVDVKAP